MSSPFSEENAHKATSLSHTFPDIGGGGEWRGRGLGGGLLLNTVNCLCQEEKSDFFPQERTRGRDCCGDGSVDKVALLQV